MDCTLHVKKYSSKTVQYLSLAIWQVKSWNELKGSEVHAIENISYVPPTPLMTGANKALSARSCHLSATKGWQYDLRKRTFNGSLNRRRDY